MTGGGPVTILQSQAGNGRKTIHREVHLLQRYIYQLSNIKSFTLNNGNSTPKINYKITDLQIVPLQNRQTSQKVGNAYDCRTFELVIAEHGTLYFLNEHN